MQAKAAELFTSTRIDPDAMSLTMRWASQEAGQVIDPHSAIGLAAARASDLASEVPIVTLATAHPAKFREAVERATGMRPQLPPRIAGLFDREERYERLPARLDSVEGFIAERAVAAA
jgi:threonine synthase